MPSTRLISDAEVRAVVIEECVKMIPPKLEKFGGTSEQDAAVTEAFGHMLSAKLYEEDAREALKEGGFSPTDIDRIIEGLRKGYEGLS